jgi:probable HAF family extracellular repeat protein
MYRMSRLLGGGVILLAGLAAPTDGAQAGAAGAEPHRRIRVVEVAAPDSGLQLDQLSERGHVTLWGVTDGRYRSYQWHRGEMTELEPGAARQTITVAMNRRGEVAGYTTDPSVGSDSDEGFVWSDGVMTAVPDRAGSSAAQDVDDHGRVLVNRRAAGATRWRASVVDGDREVTSPDVAGGRSINGVEMNNRGVVIGYDTADDVSAQRAYVWRPGREPVDVGSLGGTWTLASEINDAGTVLGYSFTAGNAWERNFLWRRGRMIDLGTLGGAGSPLNFPNSGRPDLLNERDQVAGTSFTAAGHMHAFLWSDGHMRDLGTLGGDYSGAAGINDRGEVSGVSSTASGEFHGFLWRDGTMIDLGALTGSPFSMAWPINDRGQVAGVHHSDAGAAVVLWETRNRR